MTKTTSYCDFCEKEIRDECTKSILMVPSKLWCNGETEQRTKIDLCEKCKEKMLYALTWGDK